MRGLTRFYYTNPTSGVGGRNSNGTPHWLMIVILSIICLTLLAMCGLVTWAVKG